MILTLGSAGSGKKGGHSEKVNKKGKEAMYLMSQTLDVHSINRNGILIRGLIILLCAGIINATSVSSRLLHLLRMGGFGNRKRWNYHADFLAHWLSVGR